MMLFTGEFCSHTPPFLRKKLLHPSSREKVCCLIRQTTEGFISSFYPHPMSPCPCRALCYCYLHSNRVSIEQSYCWAELIQMCLYGWKLTPLQMNLSNPSLMPLTLHKHLQHKCPFQSERVRGVGSIARKQGGSHYTTWAPGRGKCRREEALWKDKRILGAVIAKHMRTLHFGNCLAFNCSCF